MKIFTIIGGIILKLFDLMGMLILLIPKLPSKLKNINTGTIKDRVDTEALKYNVSKIKKDNRLYPKKGEYKSINVSKSQFSGQFTSEEKERAILQLQISSLGFVAVSMIYILNFLSFLAYAFIGLLIVAYVLYLLYSKVKLMYEEDFNAYRDFFLMYIVDGVILILISSNPDFMMAFSFLQFFPALSVLIFAVISVLAIWLIFRIRYSRDYTYGEVIEAGKKTAYVKVEYDIRSNVKPDIYLVESSYNVEEGDIVKLQIDGKLLSTSGNKPMSIIGTVNIA